MPSGYDPYYDAPSLYSHPLASRNSSSTTTTSGPPDDFRASRYLKGDVVAAAPPEVFYGELSRTTTLATSMERGGSSQSDANSRAKARVGRRGTTKELIGRYESMSSDGTRTRVGTSTGFLKDRGSSGGSIQTPENKGRGRSPIRQSLRNLLSVFSKKDKLSSRDSSLHVADLLSPPNGIAEETDDITSLPLPPPKRPSLSRLQSSPQQIPATPQDFSHPTCTTPIPMYSGRLFHLCPPVVSGGLPIWAECDVVLHSSHVLITWHSNSGNPSTSVVQIGQCTDVRSLNPEDLGTAERSQLPDIPDCGGLKIFELLFIGQSGEKFAARSLQERAGWVSAVWDVVLRASENTPSLRRYSLASNSGSSGAENLDPRPSSRRSLEMISESPEPRVQQRSLPALPVATPVARHPMEPLKYELYDAPVPNETPTPSRSAYSSRLPTPSPKTSPSLRNLDQRSVVRARLAEMERASSARSSPLSPAKSTRSRQIVDSPIRTESPCAGRGKQSVLLRHGTISSLGQDSIIDSYAGEDRHSQISDYSGRLTSIQDENEDTPWMSDMPSKLNSIQQDKDAVFSPASAYSDARPPFKPFSPPPPLPAVRALNIGRSDSPKRFLEAHRRTPLPDRPPSVPLKDPAPAPAPASAPVPAPSTVSKPPPVSLPDPTLIAASVEQTTRLSGLRQQISSVQTELRNLPESLGTVVASRPLPPIIVPTSTDEDSKQLLQTIGESVKRVEDQGGAHAEGLTGIQAKVDQLLNMHKSTSVFATSGVPGLPTTEASTDVSAVLEKLDELRAELKTDLPALSRNIEDILAAKAESRIMRNASPSGASASEAGATLDDGTVSALRAKLEEILSAVQAPKATEDSQHDDASAQLAEVMELLKTEQTHHEAQLAQQADSARYLNELNTWLETFVKHGTAQIEAVSGGVQHLCQEFGPIEVVGEDGQPVIQEQRPGVMSDIRQMLAEGKTREDNIAALQMSMNALVHSVHEGFQQSLQVHAQNPTETIASLIDGQRRDQEQMLRNLAVELSNDIRGERLRFVEAMKEATTINVQIHVEEFKKELTREVMSMTSEVTRLHKERQALEGQIADLFAFYAKQKQSGESKQPARKKGRAPPLDMQFGGSQGGVRRPLPVPSPGANPVPGGMYQSL